jgi:hypothetical protein
MTADHPNPEGRRQVRQIAVGSMVRDLVMGRWLRPAYEDL